MEEEMRKGEKDEGMKGRRGAGGEGKVEVHLF